MFLITNIRCPVLYYHQNNEWWGSSAKPTTACEQTCRISPTMMCFVCAGRQCPRLAGVSSCFFLFLNSFRFSFILRICSSLCFYLHSQLVLTVGRRDTAVHSQLRKTKAFETPRYVRIDSELLLFRGCVLRTNIFSHFPSNSSIPCCKLYNVSQYIW